MLSEEGVPKWLESFYKFCLPQCLYRAKFQSFGLEYCQERLVGIVTKKKIHPFNHGIQKKEKLCFELFLSMN